MIKFREKNPNRQKYKKVLKSHNSHRNRLKKDFNDRCGYCDAPRKLLREAYHIDHFAPTHVFETTHSKRLNEYTNLMYACPSCNRSKSNKWVTTDFDNGISGNTGFIKPCSVQYDQNFYRDAFGAIFSSTPIGEWMRRELRLFLPRHSLVWQLEKIKVEMSLLEKSMPNDPTIKDLAYKFVKLLEQIEESQGG